jgi:hypothetical protein
LSSARLAITCASVASSWELANSPIKSDLRSCLAWRTFSGGIASPTISRSTLSIDTCCLHFDQIFARHIDANYLGLQRRLKGIRFSQWPPWASKASASPNRWTTRPKETGSAVKGLLPLERDIAVVGQQTIEAHTCRVEHPNVDRFCRCDSNRSFPGDLHFVWIEEKDRPVRAPVRIAANPLDGFIRICVQDLDGPVGELRFQVSSALDRRRCFSMNVYRSNGGSISRATRADPFVMRSSSGISIRLAVSCRLTARSPVPAKASM